MYMYYILFISVVSSIPVVLVILDCSCWPPFLPGKRTRARLALYFENNWKMHQSFHKEKNRYNLMYTEFITLNLQLCSALFCRICFNYDKRFYSFTWLRFQKGIFKPWMSVLRLYGLIKSERDRLLVSLIQNRLWVSAGVSASITIN